jgi:hypothetical protein
LVAEYVVLLRWQPEEYQWGVDQRRHLEHHSAWQSSQCLERGESSVRGGAGGKSVESVVERRV